MPEAEMLAAGPVGTDAARSMPAPAATMASASQAAPVLQQLSAAVQASGVGVTEIRLEPVELGRVTLTLSSVDAGITVTVAADRPETADLIRRHLDSLSAELRQIGYGSVSYSFTNSGSGRGADRGGGMADGAPGEAGLASEDPPPAEAAPRRSPLAGDGALDIRM